MRPELLKCILLFSRTSSCTSICDLSMLVTFCSPAQRLSSSGYIVQVNLMSTLPAQ